MSKLKDIVEFRSDRFAPFLPEEAQVNDGVYGYELAAWLCGELAKRGFATSYPHEEDWCWFLDYSPKTRADFYISCVNERGTKDRWCVGLGRYGNKLFGRGKPPYESALSLVDAIRSVVQEAESLSEICWLFE